MAEACIFPTIFTLNIAGKVGQCSIYVFDILASSFPFSVVKQGYQHGIQTEETSSSYMYLDLWWWCSSSSMTLLLALGSISVVPLHIFFYF